MIRTLAIATVLLVAASPALGQAVHFSDAPVGALPAEFELAQTGGGEPGRWEVVEDAEAEGGRAFAQLSEDATNGRFPLAIYTPTVLSNVDVSVHFKAISGTVDQAGGVALRLVDADNYYLARANALEGNVRFYRVMDGRREELAGANLEVTGQEWHILGVRAEGDMFTISYDGEELFEAQDTTFDGPGKVALWTKADSVTLFDRIEIEPLP